MAKPATDAEQLAALCAQVRTELHHAGRALHDQVGPLLSIAGMLLDQLRSDYPATAAQVNEVLQRLEEAMEHVRQLSQRVNPTPAIRTGLKRALTELSEQNPGLRLSFKSTAREIPGPIVAALYETSAAAVTQALRAKATRVSITVTGSTGIHIKIADNGAGSSTHRRRALETMRLLAAQAGIEVKVAAVKMSDVKLTSRAARAAQSTIVSIQYASRRSAGG